MNSKKLIKVIKTIVEAEVAKKQETFLKKTFPKILDAVSYTHLRAPRD